MKTILILLLFILIGCNTEPEYTTIEATVKGINTIEYIVGEAICDTLTIDSTIFKKLSDYAPCRYYRIIIYPDANGIININRYYYISDSLQIKPKL
jgi:hypothetical protein